MVAMHVTPPCTRPYFCIDVMNALRIEKVFKVSSLTQNTFHWHIANSL